MTDIVEQQAIDALRGIQCLKRSIMIDVGSCHANRGQGASSAMREDDRDMRRDIEAAFAAIDAALAALSQPKAGDGLAGYLIYFNGRLESVDSFQKYPLTEADKRAGYIQKPVYFSTQIEAAIPAREKRLRELAEDAIPILDVLIDDREERIGEECEIARDLRDRFRAALGDGQ